MTIRPPQTATDDVFDSEEFAESGVSHERSPISYVLRALRGRYLLTGALCVVLAAAFGAAGYSVTSPKYTSSGVVRIAPTRPVILYENELNESMDSFESFVETQAVLIQSPRIIEAALEDEKLKESSWPSRPRGREMFLRLLEVEHSRRSEVIRVSITHEDSGLAQTAVNAVLDAYMRIARDKAAQEFGNREQELVELRDEYQREYENARDQAYRLAESAGASDLESELAAKREELSRLESLVNSLELNTSSYDGASSGDGGADESAVSAMGTEALARYDQTLAELVDRRESMELRRDSLRDSGMRSQHREMQKLESELATLNRHIEDQTERVRAALTSGDLSLSSGEGSSGVTFQHDLQRLKSARALRDKLSEEVIRLGRAQLRIDYYEDRAADFAKRRDNAERRLETFRVEGRSNNLGRMELWQRGTRPTSPSVDRRKPLAALGAMGGCGLGVASVLGLAFVRPTYRHVEDIPTGANDYILGMLPDLDLKVEGIDEMASASIHRIRGLLDAKSRSDPSCGTVHAVLSATAGEGKTNLAFGLASSFAKTGKRTLLIDADLIAPSVSIELDLLETDGLAQAVAEGRANGMVHQTATPNFFCLAAGVRPSEGDTSEVADTLSRDNLRGVLDELRTRFDEIIIDTGPLLGSIESVASAAVADGAVFVVGRGQHPSKVRSALEHLRMLGVDRVGVVFNRACMADLTKSSLSVLSNRSVSVAREPGRMTKPARKFIEAAASSDENNRVG